MLQLPERPVKRIGFVSFRISGTDGVSLEIGKWTEILERMGYECFFVCGHSDRPEEKTFQIEEADFRHPDVAEINRECFGRIHRSPQVSSLIRSTATTIKEQLYTAIHSLNLDLLIAENCLTIPMNIPLGSALEDFVMETRMPCIAHHHDFVWERQRYMVNAVQDYLHAIFPPPLPEIGHIVISSVAGEEFGRRTGLQYRVVPNVMNFDEPPPGPDEYSSDFRESFGIGPDDFLILQPTRVVPRKGIEHTIELIRRLDDPRCKLMITHNHTDEGSGYYERIRSYARLLGVEVIFATERICSRRHVKSDGRKCYSIWDAYPHADLIAYPSTYEGFGNAFLEAVHFRKPVFCNRYTIFQTDIEPLGFRCAAMDGFLTDRAVEEVRALLFDNDRREVMVEHNYQLARRYFSYHRVENELRSLLSPPWAAGRC
ncbi:Glycosyl transferases group 1 [Maioricimonas rarisocia]|uniref:Glycosyl transferases group 1 n=1 Tax=Maioricimonas rarisocia TaxID=2528026 RepID=A0A517Z0A1_9PLAN|nr:glycosyltransferase family 4 protein [Maioricimonas rarisocia]QDU35911.1 Glycosyl transferases group 1 [Maioricimonas rarisocia]